MILTARDLSFELLLDGQDDVATDRSAATQDRRRMPPVAASPTNTGQPMPISTLPPNAKLPSPPSPPMPASTSWCWSAEK
jgi:hypothetical protein